MYSDIHRNILQYIMNAGIILYIDIVKYYNSLSEDESDSSHETLDNVIVAINNRIKPFDQEIRKGVCEITGSVYFIFINTSINDISKLQSEYKEKDIQLFKVIIDEIIKSPEKHLSPDHLIHLFEKYKIPHTLESSQQFIDDLIIKGYLYDLESSISFGIRLIYECDMYLRELYSDLLKECVLCKQLVFVGCSCKSCDILLHNGCFEKYITKRNKCPNCNEDLRENIRKPIKRLKVS